MKLDTSPEALAKELLGRPFAELDVEERAVLHRVSTGEVMGLDADERAAAKMTFGDRLSDKVAAIGGSWAFICSFAVVLLTWMVINSRVLEDFGLHPFDAYPYIFLNLMLSMLAALQAPIIMMSQNRQAQKDRVSARHDYEVNLRTTIELLRLHRKIDHVLARLGQLEGVGPADREHHE
ncbi:hypothetical protein MB02_15050 [Croceicoccus estronivorus]|uniref:DUF1003 domain-containing protein n=1 Tax=Croceicoccus estronivorus TaxID=1172626 RepID=UPI00082C5450|nr:DUF1003 domain-containing protein [Croceicoccus estronivorus]OCC22732.1 hypothetical protein MB02_15050 [Croceicoccus estronivorus]